MRHKEKGLESVREGNGKVNEERSGKKRRELSSCSITLSKFSCVTSKLRADHILSYLQTLHAFWHY